MGIDPLGRLHDVVTGLGGGIQAPFGMAWDLARAPFVDDDVDGFLGTLNAVTISRTSQLFGNLLGPEEGLGAVIGGLPEGGRQTLGRPIQSALGGLETAGREGIREPLSALTTVGSLASSKTYGEQGGHTGYGGLLDPQTWKDAYKIAQHRSFGQSMSLLWGTKDILDEEEVERYQGTDMYTFSSGAMDALIRLYYEPDRLAGKAFHEYRLGTGAAESRLGTIRRRAAPQLGRRAEQAGLIGADVENPGRLQRTINSINEAADRSYERLPEPIRKAMFLKRDFDPRDVARLERLEATRQELGIPSPGPEVREQFATQMQRDIDRYFEAGAGGARRKLVGGRHWAKVDRLIESFPEDVETRSGLIRDRLFPTHPEGDILSHFLATAKGPAERADVMRIGMGDMRALERLSASNYALSRQLEDLTWSRSVIEASPVMRPIRSMPGEGGGQLSMFDEEYSPVLAAEHKNYSERLAEIAKEQKAVVDEQLRNKRLGIAYKTLPAGPTVTAAGALRNTIKSSSIYQDSFFGKAVRLVTDMRPHHIVDAGDSLADAQLSRMLREAGYTDDAIARARGQFMALDPQLRGNALSRWVERAEAQILKDTGLSQDDIAEVLKHAQLGKDQAASYIRSSLYDAEGRARLRFHDGDEMIDMPLLATQLENMVPVPNLARLRKAAERYARLTHGDDWRSVITRGGQPGVKVARFADEALKGVMDVWRPTVLLRPAWTFRVVGDEQMRMVAKFGALSVLLGSHEGVDSYMARLKESPIFRRVLGEDARRRKTGSVLAAATGMAAAGPIGGAALGAIGNRLVKRMAEAEEAGILNLRFGGHSVSGPWGDTASVAEAWKARASARSAAEEMFGLHSSRILGGLRRNPKEWRTFQWGLSETDDVGYRAAWADHASRHLASDPMARQLLAGKSADEVLDWLDNTLEGRRHAANLPFRYDHEAWVAGVADQINAYTGGLEDVKRAILEMPAEAGPKRWQKLLDDIPEDIRAPIHGAALADTLGTTSPVLQAVKGFVDNSFEVLSTMATDTLSRNPTFSNFYRAEMQRLLADVPAGSVPHEMITGFEERARSFALRETRELLYDLAESSRFGDMARQLIPFYGAWQEVLTRWAGLAVENPNFRRAAVQAWRAPDKLGWTYTDDRGNDFLRIRIPKFAQSLVNQGMFHGALDSQGYIFLDKKGMNLVAQGTPGFGPFVQWSVSEMVKQQPSLEESVRFILPFGPSEGLADTFLPPTVKRAMAAKGDEGGAAFANAEARILTTKLVQMEQGDLPQIDMSDPAARKKFLAQVHDEARQFMSLRFFTGFVAPVAPLYESPYKPYVDIYRAIRDGDYKRAEAVMEKFDVPGELPKEPDSGEFVADDVFLESFGEEFFALTQAFTKSVSGVPPTLEALKAGEKYGDLVTRYPEWASVVAGYDGGPSAQFSRAVYDRQLAKGERRRLTPDEILTGPETRLGWMKYSRFMDLIDSIRVERGLPNLNVKRAEPLRQMKKLVIQILASKYPGWYEEFGVTDSNKWNSRIEGARALTADKDLVQRPDIAGLKNYLGVRDAITAMLAGRKQTSITASSNRDIAAIWSSIVARIVEQNPEFADLYYRKLENDPLTVPTEITLAA